jgi:hypothetical protein
MPLKIRSAILCDLVRTEDNGKHIIIGVYTGDVLFAEFPAKFAPTFWIEFKPFEGDEEMAFEVKMDIPGAKVPRIGAGKIKAERGKAAILVSRGPVLEIKNPGILRLSIRSKGGRWIQAIAKDVGIVESSPPSA